MNGLIASIITGVVVTVIGAFAAYYFGVRQERLRQAYEREKEARTQQEEKQREEQNQLEEQQRELNKQRAETFDEIRSRVFSIIEGAEAFNAWGDSIKALAARKPAEGDIEFYGGAEKAWRPYFQEASQIFVVSMPPERVKSFNNEVTSFQQFYQAHESHLKPSTRELCRAFNEEILEERPGEEEEEVEFDEVRFYEARAAMQEITRVFDQVEQQRNAASGRFLSFLYMPNDKKLAAAWREAAQEMERGYLEIAEEIQTDKQRLQWYRTAFANEKAQYDG